MDGITVRFSGELGNASPAINAAIEEAELMKEKYGGFPTVYIPPGVYLLDEPIIVSNSDITIRGSGFGTYLRHRSGDYAFYLHNPAKSIQRITIKDLTIFGEDNQQGKAGIFAKHVTRSWFKNLRIVGYRSEAEGAGIRFEDSWILEVASSILSANSYGIYTHKPNSNVNALQIHDCIIEGNLQAAIEINGGHQVSISRCTIEGIGVPYGLKLNTGSQISVRDCYFEFGDVGVCSILTTNSAYLHGVTIDGCRFKTADPNGNGNNDYHIEIDGCNGINIVNNVFIYDAHNTTCIVFKGQLYTNNINVDGNTVHVNSGSDPKLYRFTNSPFRRGMIHDPLTKKWTYGEDDVIEGTVV